MQMNKLLKTNYAPGIYCEIYYAIIEPATEYLTAHHVDFHIEGVTRQFHNSILSPSWKLLRSAKEGHWLFETYKKYFLAEMTASSEAQKHILTLRKLACQKAVFLVCVEHDPRFCHRSILANLILPGSFPGKLDLPKINLDVFSTTQKEVKK